MKNRISNHIAEWIFVLLCAALGIATFAVVPNIGSLILILAAVFALPLPFILKLWGTANESNSENAAKGLFALKENRYRAFVLLLSFLSGLIVVGEAHKIKADELKIQELTAQLEAVSQEHEDYHDLFPSPHEEPSIDIDDLPREEIISDNGSAGQTTATGGFDLESVPAFDGQLYCEINGNIPFFTEDEYTTKSFERYSPLDDLGRCGVAYACVGVDIMPTEPRDSIGMIKPTGWMISKYDFIDGKYLYNRCHLIAHQLAGENANKQNLITGTRFMNASSMEPFESLVGGYVRSTENHVLYRVTPVFVGNNLLASGVLMEGYSVEDNGEGVCFCIFCHNAQPRVGINYADGSNWLLDEDEAPTATNNSTQTTVVINESVSKETTAQHITVAPGTEYTYIVNNNTMRFHYEWCNSAEQIAEKNKGEITGTRDELIEQGYKPCGVCHP